MLYNTHENLSRFKFLEIYDAIQYRQRYINPFHIIDLVRWITLQAALGKLMFNRHTSEFSTSSTQIFQHQRQRALKPHITCTRL